MASLDPNPAAARSGAGGERSVGGQPEPGLRLKGFAAFTEPAVEDQDFDPAGRRQRDVRTRPPFF